MFRLGLGVTFFAVGTLVAIGIVTGGVIVLGIIVIGIFSSI